MKARNFVASTMVFLMLVGLTVYGVYYNKMAQDYEIALENQYNRAFTDLVEHTNNVEEYLLKALATGTPQKRAQLLENAWNSATQAAACLSMLPMNHNMMSKVQNFLVQIGDISYSWNNGAIRGEKITDDDYKTLTQLYGYATELNSGLFEVYSDFTSQRYNWRDIQKDSEKVFSDDTVLEKYESLSKLTKPFENYPALIYDGPFSTHMSDIKPKGLKGDNITKEQGADKIYKYFSDRKPTVNIAENNRNANIKTYSYTVSFEEEDIHVAYVDLTEVGGMVYYYLLYRDIGEPNLSAEQATQIGKDFLARLGVVDMEPSYHIIEDNLATINYVYVKEGVRYYPDMMKVKVALDTGEVIGLESHAYITSHHDRKTPTPKITAEEAQEKVSPLLTIEDVNKAVIPNDFGGEHFVYEFKCNKDDRNFLVYIDAEDGSEVEVLILLEKENGVLTV